MKTPCIRINIILSCLFWVGASTLAPNLQAQNYAIDWYTIDGGGGISTGGVYLVHGTIGQPDANPLAHAGGNFSLQGGFWSLDAIQAPHLGIRRAPTNTLQVFWASPATGFALQQNTQIHTTNWVAAPEPVLDNGTNKFIIVNPPAGTRFYRLIQP